jgi:hypothetical protein
LKRRIGQFVRKTLNAALRPLGWAVVARREIDSVRVAVDELKRQNTQLLVNNAAMTHHAARLGTALRRGKR